MSRWEGLMLEVLLTIINDAHPLLQRMLDRNAVDSVTSWALDPGACHRKEHV